MTYVNEDDIDEILVELDSKIIQIYESIINQGVTAES